jgi:hypothetical protein
MATHSNGRRAWLALERLEVREVPATSPWTFETFEQSVLGVLPPDLQQYGAAGRDGFAVANSTVPGSTRNLRSTGGSAAVQRVWHHAPTPADVTVSVSIFLDRLIPAQVIARGRNLESDAPTYYVASVVRGMTLQLSRVENGHVAVLATLQSKEWLSNKWVRVSLTTVGDQIRVRVFRTDTAQYMDNQGRWQSAAVDAVHRTDGAITGGGFAGIGRSAKYAGAVQFDNFQIAPAMADSGQQVFVDESFARPVAGGLPADWAQWSGSTATFRVSTARVLTGSAGLSITSPTTAPVRAWYDSALPADGEVTAAVYLNSLVPAEIIARGQNLNTALPAYYAATITRGLEVQLVRVVEGQRTVLATLDSQAWISNKWIHATLSLHGDAIRILVYRGDTSQYLNSAGVWQDLPAWAIESRDSAITGAGLAGLGRAGGAAGTITFDSFAVTSQAAAHPLESTPQLPDEWTQWSNTGTAAFAETTANAQTPPSSIVSHGSSDLEARAWIDESQAADISVGASIYLDSLVPAQVILRGKSLGTSSPTFYAVTLQRGLVAQLTRVVDGRSMTLSTVASNTWDSGRWVHVQFQAQGSTLQVQIRRSETGEYLNEDGDWQDDPAAAMVVNDTAIAGDGVVGLGRQASYSGPIYFDDFAFEIIAADETEEQTDSPASSPVAEEPLPSAPAPVNYNLPSVDRHYSHIRIAQLAYHGTPLGTFEQDLLRNSVDLVVPNTGYLEKVNGIAPNTPQLIYSNASNIYRELLTDWLTFADRNGYDRETAFYHVTQPTEFTGDSASSVPVNRFWSVQVGDNAGWSDRTNAAHSSQGNVTFAGFGQSVALGYLEPFREINAALASGARDGWAAKLEYVAAVDAAGNPVVWKPLALTSDATAGLTRSGQMSFDPPRDWIPASINGSEHMYYVRLRTSAAGTAPVATTLLGRDYVNAAGKPNGIIPVFDKAADLDGDGYLNDAEYARRAAGKNARFYYESRAFYPAYGQHRYATNVADPRFQEWAADFSYRFLQENPLANGLFMDNSLSKITLDPKTIAESLSNYAQNYAQLLSGINQRIAPKWVLVNIAGGGTAVDALAQRGISYLDEFLIRPISASYSQFEDVAANLARRLSLSGGKSYAVLDSLAPNGSMADPRVQIGTLAYCYLLADPTQTMLMFNGGNEPNSTWTRHWSAAVEFNVGQPNGQWSLLASGHDPADVAKTYKVYQRRYDNALVLFKPLSYSLGIAGTTDDRTATVHQLGRAYRPLQADGTLGAAITSIRLRNGEGAILVPV